MARGGERRRPRRSASTSASVLELDEAGETLTLVAARRHAGLARSARCRMPLAQSANAGHTLRTGEPMIVEDLATETRFAPSPTLLELGVVSSVERRDRGPRPAVRGPQRHTRASRARSPRTRSRSSSAIATLITVAVERDREEQATRHARAARPAHRPAEPHAARSTGSRTRSPAGGASGIDVAVLVLDLDRFKLDQRRARPRRRRRAAARARAAADRRAAPDRHGRAPRRRRVRRHLPGRRRGAARRDRRSPSASAAAVTRPLVLDSGEHFFTVSIGITLAAHDARHARVAAARRRRRDVPRQGARPRRATSCSTRRCARRPMRARAHRDRAAPRARPRRARGLLPAGDRPARPAGRSRPRRSCAGSTPSAAWSRRSSSSRSPRRPA